ncbi:MAG: 1,4-alpha-glucan branching protein GlgB [Ruminococcus sp.]|nr:1,4-alpha-glucan branching protein GlgB [Ruminococcus sp.]
MDLHQFYLGTALEAYTYFGAHVQPEGGVLFRTLAPNAERVSLICESSGWNEIPMERETDGGIYRCWLADAEPGQMYKYRIYIKNADVPYIDHCDPYGFGMELRPKNASIIRDLKAYTFHDEAWMQQRGNHHEKPVNIYEVHLGSWMTNPDDENGYYRYEEIAPKLVEYVKEQGYNYIEFMPLSEHPADCSWGYQNTGFFSPTSRYGDARGLMELVDLCHQSGIGVIMDYVPVHFAVDGYGLANYDGTFLYEYPEKEITRSEWGSCNFNHSRGEVCSFLASCANYWLTEFHFDGIRMDAVSRLIYWYGDPNSGVNPNSLNFLKSMNSHLRRLHPDVMLIAEDSTNYDGVTRPVEFGGLGFDYKWDMGWMNDTLDYFRAHPWSRKDIYHMLTFSMMYYYNERYLLPLSHDETVHGKATIVQKMFGDYEQKFPQARALYMYMYLHPGKKLNFMGNEIGQLREWTEEQEQDWSVLRYPMHDSFHQYMKQLCQLYMSEPALSAGDYRPDGFRWIDCHQEEKCIYAFERRAGEERILALFHFDDARTEDFTFTLEQGEIITPLLNSQWEKFSGTLKKDTADISGEASENGYTYHVQLPPFCGAVYKVKVKNRNTNSR